MSRLRTSVIVDTVRTTLAEFGLTSPERPILVALSGGPDSVALFSVLRELGIPIEAAHFDHQARGEASARDRVFVESLAASAGCPCHVGSRPVLEESAKSPLSFEGYARQVRYAFLTQIARTHNFAAIATGHHADDQAETVLMRIIRGASPKGLGGIPPETERAGVRIIRPLIRVSRDEIMRYIAEHRLAYCIDASNEDTGIFRNRVRQELIPMLEKSYNPQVRSALCRLADLAREEDEVLDSLAAALAGEAVAGLRIDRGRFQGPKAVRRRALERLFHETGLVCDNDLLERAADFIAGAVAGKRLDIGAGWFLCSAREECVLVSGSEQGADGTDSIAINPAGVTLCHGVRVEARPLAEMIGGNIKHHCGPSRQVFPARIFDRPVYLRRRRKGDRFRPLGLKGSKTLSDYFTDRHVPLCDRDTVLLLASDDEILWVVGHGIAASAAVQDSDAALVAVTVTDATG